MKLVTALLCVACLITPLQAQKAMDDAALQTLLDQAADYIVAFETQFSNVVSQERYVQNVRDNLSSGSFNRAPVPTDSGSKHRELVSDFLLVKLAETGEWVPFRDVFEVDGKTVRDREDRLTRLFIRPAASSLDQAYEIMEESTRYNIGNLVRTINLPMFAMEVLKPRSRSKFQFSKARLDSSAGDDVYVVEYREETMPSLIRGPGGRDMPAQGRLWLENVTGRVMRTEIVVEDPDVRASLVTRYQMDTTFEVAIPIEMKEDYLLRGGRVTGTATYTNFRRFGVQTSEKVGSDKAGSEKTGSEKPESER